MLITNKKIDGGKAFDWGRTSEDYAKFRDIYPDEFYQKITDLGLCVKGQDVLDIGTGTGVLPRNMFRYGANWTGTDISPEQIAQAERLSQEAGMKISYFAVPTEELAFPPESFDVITACQCFWYFDHEQLMPRLYHILKPNGVILVLYMAWLPFEDAIAGESEQVVLKYNPTWSGAGETMHPIEIPPCYANKFTVTDHEEYLLSVPFSQESWHGRMKACRGVGASLSDKELQAWEQEHRQLLSAIAPPTFTIRHYAALAVLQKQ